MIELQQDLFTAMLRQDVAFYESGGGGADSWELKQLLMNAEYVMSTALDVPAATAETLSQIVSSLIILRHKSPRLLVLLAAMLPVAWLVSIGLGWVEDVADTTGGGGVGGGCRPEHWNLAN